MKIYQKVLASILWITAFGWVVFAGLNYYEATNQCNIKMNSFTIECDPGIDIE